MQNSHAVMAWEFIRLLMMASVFTIVVLTLIVFVGNEFGLSLSAIKRNRIGLILIFMLLGLGVITFWSISTCELCFEAVIYWSVLRLLGWILALLIVLGSVLLIASVVSRRWGRALKLIIIILLAVLGIFSSTRWARMNSADKDIINFYNKGIQNILENDIQSAKIEFLEYKMHAWLLDIYRPNPYFVIQPDIDEAENILASIDGGLLSQEDISNSKLQSKPISISYAIKPIGDYIIFLNMLPDGRIYLLCRNVYSTNQIGGVAVQQVWGTQTVPDNVKTLILQRKERMLMYQCPECYSGALSAYLQEPVFKDNPTIQVGDFGSLEYYNLSSNGHQVNGYWEQSTSSDAPPWSIFRQAILNVISDTLEYGTTVSPETYLNNLQEAEAEYGFKSLTGYQWSKFYIENTTRISN